MNKSLYCFKVDEQTGLIELFTFTEYKIIEVSSYTHRKEIRFDSRLVGTKNKSLCCFRYENLDKFVNGRVLSFDSNYNKAFRIIEESLRQKITHLEKELIKTKNIYNKVLQL